MLLAFDFSLLLAGSTRLVSAVLLGRRAIVIAHLLPAFGLVRCVWLPVRLASRCSLLASQLHSSPFEGSTDLLRIAWRHQALLAGLLPMWLWRSWGLSGVVAACWC